MFREEVRSLEMVKLKMSERIRELESEMKELKEKMNNSDTVIDEKVGFVFYMNLGPPHSSNVLNC